MDQQVQSQPIGVRLFGDLAIEDGRRRLGPASLGGVRPKQVLEILLAARGHRVSTERLAELLWGSDPPQNAAGSIQTFVSVLRRSLVLDRDLARRLVATEPGAYRFASELADVDLDRFDELTGRAGNEPPGAARRTLEQALAIARGEVLEDEPYAQWAYELRRTYRMRVLDTLLDAAEIALAEQDFTGALAHCDSAAALDGFSDRAIRTAMLALYALGRQHDALARYRAFRASLDAELGLVPSGAARELESAILRQDDPPTLLPRLRTPTPVGRGAGRPGLLGRTRELESLQSAVRSGLESRFALVLVEGEAGVGKTRLLDELEATLPGVRIGRVACSFLEQHLGYVPLAAALRDARIETEGADLALGQILPELGAASDTREYREVEALEALVQTIAANAPLVVMLDDLQWSDAATVGALSYVHRRCRALRGAIVGTIRAEHTPPYHYVRGLRPGCVIKLQPLTSAELEPLGVPGLYEATGGNPRFVADALSGGDEPSRSVAEAVLAQCRQEGPRAYRLLLAASLLEPPFEPGEIEAMLHLEVAGIAEQLELLCRRSLLLPDGVGFRFRYEVVRDILVTSLSPACVRLLQQRIDMARLARTT